MIERKMIFVACVAGTLMASCTPYPENYREDQKTPPPPTKGTVSDLEQQKLKEERKKAQQEAERNAAEAAKLEREGGTVTPPGPTDPTRPDYEFATPVAGKPGFVLSPYNGKMIDVKGMPSGTLVADPTYPASEKKYFRVP